MQQIAEPDTVVLVGEKQIRVIPVVDMFRMENQQQQMPQGQQPEFQFLGEEKITGSLLAMSMDKQPLVVFIQGGQQPVIGYQGQFNAVAERLRNLNFDVKSWSPQGGQRDPRTGQPAPPAPAPQPEDGQSVVWIVTPIAPPNMQMMQMGQMGSGQQIMAHVKTAAEKGQAVLFMAGPNPMAAMGMPDPVATELSTWGIDVQSASLVMNEVVVSNRSTSGDPTIRISSWPDALAITKALSGSAGIFVSACPIDLKDKEGVEIFPLVIAKGKRLWAQKNLQDPKPTYKEEDAADQFTVAVAAVKDDKQRIAVFADPAWATDQIVNYGMLGPGTAQMVGAMFPGNAELFVNTVFWLSNMDEMIAASARSQDIRRIGDVTPGQMVGIRWAVLAGIPLLIFAIGIGVGIKRRSA